MKTSPIPCLCIICNQPSSRRIYYPGVCFKCKMFFERSIQRKKMARCNGIHGQFLDPTRFCRSCRFQKCISVGMTPEDKREIESRKLVVKPARKKKSPANLSGAQPSMARAIQLQSSLYVFHQKYVARNIAEGDAGVIKINQKLYKCATPFDINQSLQLGFRNAIDWANQYPSFRKMHSRSKKLVIAEFGLAYLLVDQAFKSAYSTSEDFWILQNESFLSPDLVYVMENKGLYEVNDQERAHSEFVNELIMGIKKPFMLLKVDAAECAILKTMLLFTPSYLKRVSVEDKDGMVNKCMLELMKHSIEKSPEDGIGRYGELILLLGQIRCAVKSFYNQTKKSDLFDVPHFDVFVRNCFLA